MNRGMKHHYLERIENLRLAVRQLARELDVNLGAEYDHVAQTKAMEAHEHASAGLVGLARIVRETVTTPTYFTDAVEPDAVEVAAEVEEVAPCSS